MEKIKQTERVRTLTKKNGRLRELRAKRNRPPQKKALAKNLGEENAETLGTLFRDIAGG